MSCGGPTRSGSTEETYSEIPDWFTQREVSEEFYYGYGMALKQNPSLGLRTATARAREDIAQQISVKVESLLRDFMEETGVGSNAESLEFTSSVSRHIVDTVLEGSVPDKQTRTSDNTWYVRVYISRDEVINSALDAARSEDVLYTQMRAELGFEALEEAISKMK